MSNIKEQSDMFQRIRPILEECYDDSEAVSRINDEDQFIRTIFLLAMKIGQFCLECLTLH